MSYPTRPQSQRQSIAVGEPLTPKSMLSLTNHFPASFSASSFANRPLYFLKIKCLYNLIDIQKAQHKNNTGLFHQLKVSFTEENSVIFSLSQHVSVF